MTRTEFNKKARQLVVFVFFIILIFWLSYLWGTGAIETAAESKMKAFTLILWSILLEALPFVLLGTLISSLIHIYVTEATILKILPQNNFARLIFASCLGLIFPICECAIVPITRSLVKKGMPVGTAIAFMIATPIVNPIVLFSTYNAFPSNPEMVIYRGVFGFIAAITIGFLAGKLSDKSVLRDNDHVKECGCTHEHHEAEACGCGCGGDAIGAGKPKKAKDVIREIISHTSREIQTVGAYLIFGAIIAAAMQIFVPKDALVAIGTGRFSSTFVMMGLAFVLSLCSEADAFIASTFMLRFSAASVLTFLITGPMIDIKNTLMLLGSFKKRFVIKLIIIILTVCFALGILASFFMGGANA